MTPQYRLHAREAQRRERRAGRLHADVEPDEEIEIARADRAREVGQRRAAVVAPVGHGFELGGHRVTLGAGVDQRQLEPIARQRANQRAEQLGHGVVAQHPGADADADAPVVGARRRGGWRTRGTRGEPRDDPAEPGQLLDQRLAEIVDVERRGGVEHRLGDGRIDRRHVEPFEAGETVAPTGEEGVFGGFVVVHQRARQLHREPDRHRVIGVARDRVGDRGDPGLEAGGGHPFDRLERLAEAAADDRAEAFGLGQDPFGRRAREFQRAQQRVVGDPRGGFRRGDAFEQRDCRRRAADPHQALASQGQQPRIARAGREQRLEIGEGLGRAPGSQADRGAGLTQPRVVGRRGQRAVEHRFGGG
jgi:hypothetical protein